MSPRVQSRGLRVLITNKKVSTALDQTIESTFYKIQKPSRERWLLFNQLIQIIYTMKQFYLFEIHISITVPK